MKEILQQTLEERMGKKLSEREMSPLLARMDHYIDESLSNNKEDLNQEEVAQEVVDQIVMEVTEGLRLAKEQKMKEYKVNSKTNFIETN